MAAAFIEHIADIAASLSKQWRLRGELDAQTGQAPRQAGHHAHFWSHDITRSSLKEAENSLLCGKLLVDGRIHGQLVVNVLLVLSSPHETSHQKHTKVI